MRGLQRRLTGLLPVGFAVLLAAFCASGTELYVSSSGSAAMEQQLAEACRADSGFALPVPRGVDGAEPIVEEIGSRIPHMDPPRHGDSAMVTAQRPDGGSARLTLLQFDDLLTDTGADPAGAAAAGTAAEPLAPGELAVTATNAELMGVQVGSTLVAGDRVLTIARVIPDIATAPVPSAWCGLSQFVLPRPSGDPPPLSAVAATETVAMFGEFRFRWVEYRVADDPITLTEANDILAAYRRAIADFDAAFDQQIGGDIDLGMRHVVDRATGVTDTVSRSLQPVRLTSLIAVLVVLLAAAVLLARERHREVRLLGVRGVPPSQVARRMLPEVALVAGVASAVGLLLAWMVVLIGGPSSLLEPAALLRAALMALAVAVVAMGAVFAAVSVVADHAVDRGGRHHPIVWSLPVVVAGLVVLAVWSFRRLDEVGGIRTYGTQVRGGELLALGFPLFGLLAGTLVACGLLVPLVATLRRTGGRLPRALRLGWRRVVLEAGPTVATVAAVAMAAGAFVAASALSDGASRQLEDKAEAFVGSDLAVSVFDTMDVPASLAGGTSRVETANVKVDGTTVKLYGVDPATFPDVARLRDDASSLSLRGLMHLLGGSVGRGDDLPPAIGVGPDLTVGDVLDLVIAGSDEPLRVRLVATVAFFPGKVTGLDEVVVDREVLLAAVRFPQRWVLARDPDDGFVGGLRAAGFRIGVVLDSRTTFDASSFSGLKWAYQPLRAVGVLFAVVAAAVQFLVVAARRTARRAAHTISRRTGFGRRHLWVAAVAEALVPLAVGALLGLSLGLAAVSLAVPRLDPMPLLAPPARFLVPWGTTLGILLAVPVWAVATAALIVRSTVAGDPMRALRGEQ
ncbi:MAG: hypothetical protein H6513_12335 [Acidimicrobiaceae bacterium]|nr:hypothetical protein [Ilumatobacter sp.]MCB9381465.1 hypothetical protein [Acidimicrobiaceae bacterium]MCO5329255.1 hypothetical protein [Ilumatobacteraceae bacterium]